MKRLLTALALGLFIAGGVLGCEASAKIDDTDRRDDSTYYKKTTVRQSDGDRTVRTEIRREE